MPNRPALGEYELINEAALATTTTYPTVRIGDFTTLTLSLDVTASTGTTELLDIIVNAVDPAGQVSLIATFTQATGVTKEIEVVTDNAHKAIQVVATVGGGTPTFTLTLYALVT